MVHAKMTHETKQSVQVIEKQKKSYSVPTLSNYGSVAQLTMSGAFVGNDGNTKCNGNAGGNPECGPFS
jgi:hypothetical protein